MPVYAYFCEPCEEEFERIMPMSRYDEPQACPSCNLIAKKQISQVHVIFQGDDWATKNGRVSSQMAKKNSVLTQKQEQRKRDAPGVKLVPNVDGERVDSWSDAQKLAASKGKNTESYTDKIRSEKVK